MGRFTGFKLPDNYEKRDRPNGTDSSEPLEVLLKVIIIDITQVQEDRNEIELDMIIRRSWVENRLEFTEPIEENRNYAVDQVDAEKFWIPELYISGMTDLTTKSGPMDLSFFMIRKGKRVTQAVRAKVVMQCNFFFELYPLDIQQCPLDFMSPLKTASEQKMSWWADDGSPPVYFRTQLSEEKLLPRHRANLFVCHKIFNSQFFWGEVSTARIRLVLQRELKAHILDTYLPTVLFVIMSWGSFLVKPEVVPGRMVLLVTNLLSLVTLFEANRNAAPPSLSVKAVEVWLLSCIVFVFFALLEYALVLYGIIADNTERVQKLKLFTPHISSPICKQSINYSNLHKKLKTKFSPLRMKISKSCCYPHLTKKMTPSGWTPIDKISFGLFPLCFFIYNIVYWSIYMDVRRKVLGNMYQCQEER